MDNEKEISFGAFDSELMHQEIYIPEGFEATIDGDKIILTRKDNEDERIRKELIGYIVKEVGLYPGEDRKEHKWLRWLEKQGEHKKFRDSIQVGDEVTRNSDGVIVNLSQLKRVAKSAQQKLPIEKLPEEMKTIGESLGFTTQKECDEYNQMVSGLIMSADKVEPKFKVGDWIIDDKNRVGIIVRILDEHYIISFDGREVQISFEWEGKLFRKWAIQDARDGDVLCYKDEISLYKHDIKNCTKQETTFGGFVYHCCYDGKRFITDSLYSLTEQDKMDIHPATKEQRDLLFQKMKEVCYEWNYETKELKKIEQPELTEFEEAVKDMIDDYRDAIDAHAATTEEVKERAAYMLSLIPHKSAEWSEEDEKAIGIIKMALEYPYDMEGKWDRKFALDWIKSLKDRYTWKPSDVQMEALNDVISSRDIKYDVLSELWKDLKKLKVE